MFESKRLDLTTGEGDDAEKQLTVSFTLENFQIHVSIFRLRFLTL